MTDIIVTGAGSVMGQSCFRALDAHKFDQPVRVHFLNSNDLGAGRHFSPERLRLVATPICPLASDPDYIPFIEDYVDRHGIKIIFPGTQHELMKLSELRDRRAIIASVSNRVADLCSDKSKTSVLLREAGLAAPQDQLLSDWLDRPNIKGGVVVKPRSSSASRNIFRLNQGSNDAGLQAVVSQLATVAQDYVVQSLLDGPEFTCGCYLDRFSGKISTIILRRTLTEDGATLFGEVVDDSDIDLYVRGCADALRKQGFDYGHINVQLKMTINGPVAFEINGRLSSTERPKAILGFNSCAAYYENIVQQSEYSFANVTVGRKFIRYYDELYF